VDAVGSQDDCTRPGRIHPAVGIQPAEGIQPVEDSLPGIREKKRRTRQLAEAWVLREGLRALGIARRWVSQVLYLLTHCARASMRWGRTRLRLFLLSANFLVSGDNGAFTHCKDTNWLAGRRSRGTEELAGLDLGLVRYCHCRQCDPYTTQRPFSVLRSPYCGLSRCGRATRRRREAGGLALAVGPTWATGKERGGVKRKERQREMWGRQMMVGKACEKACRRTWSQSERADAQAGLRDCETASPIMIVELTATHLKDTDDGT